MEAIDVTTALVTIGLLTAAIPALGGAKMGVNALVFVWRKLQGVVSR